MRLLWLVIAVSLALPAVAADPCAEAMTTLELNQCMRQTYQHADSRLTAAYRAALQRIDRAVSDREQQMDTRTHLTQAQRLWLRFRSRDCAAVRAFWRDGSIRTVQYYGCLIAHTRHRIRVLDAFKHGP